MVILQELHFKIILLLITEILLIAGNLLHLSFIIALVQSYGVIFAKK